MIAHPPTHLFVVTYGRSGSTLLMGYLNRLPGVCVRGENNNALHHLYSSVRAVEQARTLTGKLPPDAPTHPWFGIADVDPEAYRRRLCRSFTQEVLRPPADASVVGFKEIRYDPESVPDLDDFLGFLLTGFDDARVIFNLREIADTARSKWWSKSWGAKRVIRRTRERFERSIFAGDPRCLFVRYEAFVASPEPAEAVARFLDAPFDEAVWRETLAVRHSY